MKLLIISSSFFLLILPTAYGQTEFPLKPIFNYANGFTNNSDDLLEIGLEFKLDTANDLSNLKFGARVPQDKDDKNAARIDKSTDNFNLFFGGEFALKDVAISQKNRTIFWGLEPTLEWGIKEFEFFPDSSKDSSNKDWKSNYAIEVRTRYYSTARKSGAWQLGLFGRFRYSSSNKESDAINLLNSSTSIVNEIIVSEPENTRTITPAIGFNAYPGTNLPFSFSPIFFYYWEDKNNMSDFERERFRAEQWLYFYPLSSEDVGLRIGLGSFQDVFIKGKGDDDNSFGLAISVKTETNILKSIF